jgi:hypothetical protein
MGEAWCSFSDSFIETTTIDIATSNSTNWASGSFYS